VIKHVMEYHMFRQQGFGDFHRANGGLTCITPEWQ
jgi:hypothetical protein